jgi:hypothetical protein
LTGWAGAALLKCAESSQNCVDEVASLAYDTTVFFDCPDIWEAIVSQANRIHHFAAVHGWSDDAILPQSMVLAQDGE